MSRLGCLTPFGIGAGAIAVAAVVVAALLSGGAMFSPGPLSSQTRAGVVLGGVASHAALGGGCASCHTSPLEARGMAGACLACHTDIEADLASPGTLHGALPDGASCLGCHTEHNGAAASLTKNELTSSFPHDQLGFSLAAHQRTADGRAFVCADCHTALGQSPRPQNAYALDSAGCVGCHVGYQPAIMARHRADFGDGCLSCHNGVDRYSGFSHAAAGFPLDGRHAEAGCALCHSGARAPADFTATASTCVACHAEPQAHIGQFGTDCAACHVTSAWENVVFSHRFPLDHGGRGQIACATCHTSPPPQQYATYTCYTCHSQASVAAEHREIADFSNCVRCHADGRE